MKKLSKFAAQALSALIFSLPLAFFASAAVTENVINPISYNSLSDLFQGAMTYFQTIAGSIAVIFMIVGGVMYMVSAGNKEMMEKAKKTLVFAMVGLAIVIAAPLFLSDILLILKGSGGSTSSKLMLVLLNVLSLLLSVIGLLGIMGIVNSAVIMFISTGHDQTLSGAKNAFANACIGVALAAGSLILVRTMKIMIIGSA